MPLTSTTPTPYLESPIAFDLEDAIHDHKLDKVIEILGMTPGPTQDELNMGLTRAVDKDGDTQAIDLLFDRGAQITQASFNRAFTRGDIVGWQAFVDRGWDINSMEFGDVAMISVTHSLEYVKWFLDHGADPNLRGRWEATPLIETALKSSESAVPTLQLLLANGANLEPEALLAAIQSRTPGSLQVMKFLIEQGISVNVVFPKMPRRPPPHIRRSRTPLLHAVKYANTEAVRLLLILGADKNLNPNGSGSPAQIAKNSSCLDIYSLISEY